MSGDNEDGRGVVIRSSEMNNWLTHTFVALPGLLALDDVLFKMKHMMSFFPCTIDRTICWHFEKDQETEEFRLSTPKSCQRKDSLIGALSRDQPLPEEAIFEA